MLAAPNRPNGFVDPCIPIRAPKPPAGPDWVHEIKHDGYRLIVRRDGETVRLFTRNGYDWSARYPAIAVTASGTSVSIKPTTNGLSLLLTTGTGSRRT
jgi:ATP-dependent DNA ligase